MGAAAARLVLNGFYPDEQFRRRGRVNLPLVLFALLALFVVVLVIASMR